MIPNFKKRSHKDLENKKTIKIIKIQITTVIQRETIIQEMEITEETHLLKIMFKLHNKNQTEGLIIDIETMEEIIIQVSRVLKEEVEEITVNKIKELIQEFYLVLMELQIQYGGKR